MASLTGNTIQSTYDSLLKVTDNDSITGSLKRITDGLGNNTPLYLSNSAVEIVSALNVTGVITGSNLSGTNTGDETKASIESKLGAATSSNSGYLTSTDWSTFNNKIAGAGTLNKLAKFSSSSSIADSTITDTGSAVTIGVATSVTGSLTASSIIKSGGTASQILAADGSVITAGTNITISGGTISSSGGISGSGTTNYVPKFTGSTSLGNSLIFDNGTNVGIGTASPAYKLDVNGTGNFTGNVEFAGIIYSDTLQNYTGGTTPLTIKTSGGQAVAIQTNSTERMRITSGGNVGIGTSSFLSSTRLELLVGGNANGSLIGLGNNGSANKLQIISDSGENALFVNTSATPMIFYTSNSERLRITSGGNVGIGTSSPGSLLHVGGASGPVSTPTAIEMDGTYRTGAAAFNALKFYLFRNASESYGLGLGDLGDVQYWAGSTTTGAHRFFTSQTERMRITSAGNVGIGTTSPFYKFDVKSSGTGSNTFSALFYDSSTNGNALGISNATGVSTIYSTYVGTGVNSDLAFQTTTSAGAQGERMRITSTGNVGIGTTSPLHKLDIDGGASSDGYVVLRSSTGYAAGLKIGADGSTINTQEFLIQQEPTTKLAAIFNRANGSMIFGTNNSERMRITSGGNVLIGTTSDLFNNAKLQVNGGMTYLNLFNRRTASYTLSASDQSYIVEMNVGSANNLTVPPNSSVAFPIGTEIAVLQYGAGQTTIVAGSGVTLKSKSNALKISGQYAGCTLVKVGTDEWYVIGDLTL